MKKFVFCCFALCALSFSRGSEAKRDHQRLHGKKAFRSGARVKASTTPGGIAITDNLSDFGGKIDAVVAYMKSQNDAEQWQCTDPTDFDVNFIGAGTGECVVLSKGAKAIYINMKKSNKMIANMVTQNHGDGLTATQGRTVVVDTDVLAVNPALITGILIHELGHSCLEKRGINANNEPNAIAMEVENVLQAPEELMSAADKKTYFEDAAVADRWKGMPDLVAMIYTPTSGYVNPHA